MVGSFSLIYFRAIFFTHAFSLLALCAKKGSMKRKNTDEQSVLPRKWQNNKNTADDRWVNAQIVFNSKHNKGGQIIYTNGPWGWQGTRDLTWSPRLKDPPQDVGTWGSIGEWNFWVRLQLHKELRMYLDGDLSRNSLCTVLTDTLEHLFCTGLRNIILDYLALEHLWIKVTVFYTRLFDSAGPPSLADVIRFVDHGVSREHVQSIRHSTSILYAAAETLIWSIPLCPKSKANEKELRGKGFVRRYARQRLG